MKNMYKILSLLLVVVLLFCSNSPAFALDSIISGELEPTGMNNLTVNLAVRDYFKARESSLLGEVAAMDWPIIGIVNDEGKHYAQYTSRDIQLLSTSYTITSIEFDDDSAKVSATETVSYLKDGTENTEAVLHTLTLYLNDSDIPVVVADAYTEQYSGFTSCSYVAPGLQPNAGVAGSSLCIIEIAKGELGTEETYDNITKYGEWFGQNGVKWCAIFICWCANQANISTSIIPKTSGCTIMMNDFIGKGRFYYSNSYGGTYVPQPGDILFWGDSASKSNHVSIVEKVEGNIVWVYDGNSNNKVAYNCHALTASNIVGYANPDYVGTEHILNGYHVNDTSHWYECMTCGYKVDQSLHYSGGTYYYDTTYHWHICLECEIPFRKTTHQKMLDPSGRYRCRVCNCAILEQMDTPDMPIQEEIV